ncbi:hypothetical protein HanRHA438_Chr11g0495591 [Helianthus annuus]|uniref:Uncharacterized protein n=1 Tax=Helianthus annuus TaxID=4232 RepID=A0A251TD38_HELAN|nr:hypothetical protein HanXRQr2_Chr11g0482571 [Helianthus annuus]KAJ0500982.1 hypothetical protein HanHA300_Chr11g0395511 [Helianthus annuus]KAJ0508645.1 hypothetical protein HanIR_Chr11g0519541 [Helianthus annuus]KAJ0516874.1 hypothetical protein HanHA89_Chr11g0418721 [Helianthus annuus]KAJ0684879.1 hypothetical protein HanLR1_Chr11g0396151 [Helianthus annuus]
MLHVLFLGNQLGDVETLLGQRIPLGRDFLFSYFTSHRRSLSLQSFQPCQLHALTNPKSIQSAAVPSSIFLSPSSNTSAKQLFRGSPSLPAVF